MSFKDFLSQIINEEMEKREEAGELILTEKQKVLLSDFNALEKQHDEIYERVKKAKKIFWQTVEVEHNMTGEKLALKSNNRLVYFKK